MYLFALFGGENEAMFNFKNIAFYFHLLFILTAISVGGFYLH